MSQLTHHAAAVHTRILFSLVLLVSLLLRSGVAARPPRLAGGPAGPRATTVPGVAKSTAEPSSTRSFKGMPFARPRVGSLQWHEPHALKNWTEVRRTTAFESRAMQLPELSDVVFCSASMSEDCLCLNVWTPAAPARHRRPVLAYFYVGGFRIANGSEARRRRAAHQHTRQQRRHHPAGSHRRPQQCLLERGFPHGSPGKEKSPSRYCEGLFLWSCKE